MTFLKKTFSFGKIDLPSNIFCAPLAGCSDLPFRRMTTTYRPGLVFCEMTKMDALVRNHPGTLQMLAFEPGMHPIGAQLCGSKPELAASCARMVEDLGFDVIDFNCGCPVDKVTKDGSGSAMLKTPEKIGEVIANMVAAVNIPVMVKIRAGWDSETICAPLITQIAEAAGATAICIHGRTRAQGYTGPAKWSYIREAKQAAKKIKVIGNGDIFDPLSAKKIFEETNCDAILLARGTMGQPWLIEDIYQFLGEGVLSKRTSLDYKREILRHIEYIIETQNERKALLDVRRISAWYLKLSPGAKRLRELVNKSASLMEACNHIREFSWEEVECPVL